MNVEKMIALVRRLFEDEGKEGAITLYEELFSPEIVIHGPASSQETYGIHDARKLDLSYFHAYPNMKFSIEEILALADKVFVRWICRGKHVEKFKRTSQKNSDFSIAGLSIYRIKNGKINEIWQYWDRLGLLEQIGENTIRTDLIEPGYYLKVLKSIGMEKYVEKAPFLSKRERQCLNCLLEGKTAKETALVFKISPRTVESHFENIKRKLSCTTKRDLFTAAQVLEQLKLL